MIWGGVWLQSFACAYPVVPALFVDKTTPSLPWTSLALFSKTSWSSVCGFTFGLLFLFHWFLPILCQSHTDSIASGFRVSFEIRKSESSTLFFSKVVLALLSPRYFHRNFRINFTFCKKASKDFCGDCVEAVDQFGEYRYLNQLPQHLIIYLGCFPFICL